MDPAWLTILICSLFVLIGLGVLGRAIFNNPRGDFESGVAMLCARVYAQIVHRLRVRGVRHLEGLRGDGPLIVVSNHTAGVDPVLIQVASPFHIRWVMAEDMRVSALDWFWNWWGVTFVDRTSGKAGGLRQAMRHLRGGGVVGIFPEGGLERPPREILPFLPGVGVLIRKSGARVLPVTIDGTPQVDPAWASLWHASTAVVHFHDVIDYAETSMTPDEIAEDLRRRFLTFTGWPANEEPAESFEAARMATYGRPVSVA